MTETRENWALLALEQIDWDCSMNDDVPPIDINIEDIGVTIGYGPGGTRQPLPVYVAPASDSTGNRREIFLAPTIQDAGTALCWLWYAAAIVGVDGGMTPQEAIEGLGFSPAPDVQPGPDTVIYAARVLQQVGDWPQVPMKNKHKKQSTRMIKVECTECGFHFRTSQKQIDKLTDHSGCPVCAEWSLEVNV